MTAPRHQRALFRRITWTVLLALVATLFPFAAGADAPAPPLIATIATTTVDSGGRPWAFLVFEPNKPGLLHNRPFNVYVKNGTPDAAGSFVFNGAVSATTDPTAISVYLSRAASLGDNLGALEAQVIGLHRLLINNYDSSTTTAVDPPAMPLNQRISAVLQRTTGDTSLGGLLDLLGFAHPAIRLARGTAWAAPLRVAIGADVTIEVRERTFSGADGAMIGRVSLKAGQPNVLPAPGPLAIVPDTSASGDLTVKARWATPDPLRQMGTRHHGDVAWRVARAYAEAQGFPATPPDGATLDALAISDPANVKRVGGPIFPAKLFSAGDVADFLADPSTFYLADNNDRYAAGGVPMTEGAQFYYFAAAADALGKPGPASAGVLATFCRRVPPPVPSHLAVANAWTAGVGQYLDVQWLTNALGVGTGTTQYEVFRGDDLAAHAAAQQGTLDLNASPIDPAHPTSIARIAIVADPGAVQQQILHVSNDGDGVKGKTWWFAVRAVHQGPFGGTLASALGPPVFGSLRDRTSPPAPAPADVAPPVLDSLRVACINDVPAADTVSADTLDTSVLNFTVQCDRRNRGVIAAHFHVMDGATEVVPETVAVFPADEDSVQLSWTLPLASVSDSLTVQCRAESPGGFVSAWATSSAAGVDPTGNHYVLHHFLAGAISEGERQDTAHASDPLWQSLGAPAGDWPSDLHLTYSPDTGRVFHPQFGFPFPAGAEQYRVYRRIDDGPLTLITQGLRNGAANLNCEDGAPPIWNSHVQYFTQLLDENGHGSAMRRLGSFRFTGDKPPVPVLLSPKPADFAGTTAAPTVTLTWICPPEHVDRFEVFFSTVKPPTGSGSGSGISAISNFTLRQLAVPVVQKVTNKIDQTARIAVLLGESFLTGKVGSGLGAGPQFSVTMNVDPNLKYTVFLRALGPNGEQGDSSRSIDFQWQAPTAPPPSIAWPERPLPSVGAFNSNIVAVDFGVGGQQQYEWSQSNNGVVYSVLVNQTPVGIRVGSVTAFEGPEQFSFNTFFTSGSNGVAMTIGSNSTLQGRMDPNTQLYTQPANARQRLLPCVLYRQQVANATFPAVSGDVIQASPLISSIAWRPAVSGNFSGAELVDPFFRWRYTAPNNNTHTIDLFLVDTQPVVTGATYRYWLVRFSALGEPIQTIPCGQVDIVPAP